MESWQICGVALLCALVAVVIKQMRTEFEMPVRLAGSIVLLGITIAIGIPLFSYLNEMITSSALSEYAGILIKALGIAVLTHITAEVCRDCGDASAASYVELAGKFEILLLSLPLVSSILGTAAEILNWQI
jgi:stage III sporulation protein AD